MDKELHIIIIWQNARYKEKEIIQDIQQHLCISECIEVEWSPENVASNFTRFYGVKLPNRSFKEKECGRGKFLLLTVLDENPKYEFTETSRGFELVNKNIFELKLFVDNIELRVHVMIFYVFFLYWSKCSYSHV